MCARIDVGWLCCAYKGNAGVSCKIQMVESFPAVPAVEICLVGTSETLEECYVCLIIYRVHDFAAWWI